MLCFIIGFAIGAACSALALIAYACVRVGAESERWD